MLGSKYLCFFIFVLIFNFSLYGIFSHEDEHNAHALFLAALDHPKDTTLSKQAEIALKKLISSDIHANNHHYEVRLIAILALEIEQYQHARHILMKSSHVSQQFEQFFDQKVKDSNNLHLLYDYYLYSGLIFTRYPSFNNSTKDGINSLKKALKYGQKIGISDNEKALIYMYLSEAYYTLYRYRSSSKFAKKVLKITNNSDLAKRATNLLSLSN
ncbi:MAG: hypothetical protein VW378_01175 [bacterium]